MHTYLKQIPELYNYDSIKINTFERNHEISLLVLLVLLGKKITCVCVCILQLT